MYSHKHTHTARTQQIYRVDLADCRAKYILAHDLEDAAWKAFDLSKRLKKQLINVIPDGKA